MRTTHKLETKNIIRKVQVSQALLIYLRMMNLRGRSANCKVSLLSC